MVDVSLIQPAAKIVSSDNVSVGTVKAIEGAERIRLQKTDAPDEEAHDFIPVSWVKSVEAGVVRLDRPATEIHQSLNDEIPAGEGTS